MSHRSHHRGRSVRSTWLRAAVALGIMLLAVLPHATLAAGMGQAVPAAGQSHHLAAVHDDATSAADKPCPDGERAPPMSHGAVPSCCILGCGLIASPPEPASHVVTARLMTLVPSLGTFGQEFAPEPAERPPRSRVLSS